MFYLMKSKYAMFSIVKVKKIERFAFSWDTQYIGELGEHGTFKRQRILNVIDNEYSDVARRHRWRYYPRFDLRGQ